MNKGRIVLAGLIIFLFFPVAEKNLFGETFDSGRNSVSPGVLIDIAPWGIERIYPGFSAEFSLVVVADYAIAFRPAFHYSPENILVHCLFTGSRYFYFSHPVPFKINIFAGAGCTGSFIETEMSYNFEFTSGMDIFFCDPFIMTSGINVLFLEKNIDACLVLSMGIVF